MQPLSTHSSLGINVPRVSHTLCPAWLMALVSHPSPNPQQQLPKLGGLGFPVTAKILLSLPQRACGTQVCYGEARSHFSTLNIPSPPSSQAGSKHHRVFSPLEQMFHLLWLVQNAGQALARLTNPELHTEHLQPGFIQGVGKAHPGRKHKLPF